MTIIGQVEGDITRYINYLNNKFTIYKLLNISLLKSHY